MLSAAVVSVGQFQKRNWIAGLMLSAVVLIYFFGFSAFLDWPSAADRGPLINGAADGMVIATAVALLLAVWSVLRRPSRWDLTLLAPLVGFCVMMLPNLVAR